MFKFLMISLLVCREVYGNSGGTTKEMVYDTEIPSLSVSTGNVSDEKNEVAPILRSIHINGTHQILYINNNPPAWKWPVNWINAGKGIRPDYTVGNGSEAHKVHRRKVSWNKARQICVQEGGHLADIRTLDELKTIKSLMAQNSVVMAWVGFHDYYQEGDWVTVLDEPLARMEWYVWSKQISVNPDNNLGKEHCAALVYQHDGINDDNCEKYFSFVCKMSASCN